MMYVYMSIVNIFYLFSENCTFPFDVFFFKSRNVTDLQSTYTYNCYGDENLEHYLTNMCAKVQKYTK